MGKIDSVKILNYKFQDFGNKILKTKGESPEYFISQVKKYQKQYQQNNYTDVFYKEAVDMADNFSSAGKLNYANILYSWAIKNKLLPMELRETVIQKAYKNAEKQNDIIHMLARISEMKELYKNGNKKKYINILFKEQHLLKDIINDFISAKSSYNSLKRTPKEFNDYKYKLATNKVEIAKKLLKQNPERAYKDLVSAKDIFTEFNRYRELEFVETLISQIKKERH